MSAPEPVVVAGAGLAGLACALHLSETGVPVRLLEASDGSPALDPVARPVELGGGLFVCGDYRETASLAGAAPAVLRRIEAAGTLSHPAPAMKGDHG